MRLKKRTFTQVKSSLSLPHHEDRDPREGSVYVGATVSELYLGIYPYVPSKEEIGDSRFLSDLRRLNEDL